MVLLVGFIASMSACHTTPPSPWEPNYNATISKISQRNADFQTIEQSK
ncbi:hypothetical protein AAG747_24770 [Rapidithrix thailandica]|uniref:Uncharacterized protein n=1 Tax=Rapidithrix thailandica TaxID=413964 RepID=A0AAW9S1V3_9BACT